MKINWPEKTDTKHCMYCAADKKPRPVVTVEKISKIVDKVMDEEYLRARKGSVQDLIAQAIVKHLQGE